MTHEQKPESAEFRTRGDQYNDPKFKRELECEIHIATGCRVTLYAEKHPTGSDQCPNYDRWVGHWSTPNWHYPVTRFVSVEEMERAVSEAEARGAAEQRQKDADGADIAGYISEAALVYLTSKAPLTKANIYGSENQAWPVPLYARPANVAALEARVKELEETLRNVRASIEQADPKVLVDTLWMPGQPETVVDYISAAIREGGE